MSDMLLAFNKIMDLEGGGKVHTIPGDPGGTTKWGFAQHANPNVDIANLTKLDAVWLFEAKYWTPLRCPDIFNDQMAFELAEFAFNAGFQPSVVAAQTATNDVHHAIANDADRIRQDGMIGPNTLASLNKLNYSPLAVLAWVSRFNLLQLRHYRNLRPKLVRLFLAGWTRRVIE